MKDHIKDEVARPIESLNTIELQTAIARLVEKALCDDVKRQDIVNFLQNTQEASLHIEHPITREKKSINANLIPTVISKEVEDRMSDFVIVTNLVRAATLLRAEEKDSLKGFLNADLHPITKEIMDSNPFKLQKDQWRWRADTATGQDGVKTKSIECNGGEPQGDIIVTDAMVVAEHVMSVALGEEVSHFHERPDRKMMEVLVNRFQESTGKTDIPTIGYFAWHGRSSLSHAEARYSADRYKIFFGGDAVAFDPRNILDIKENYNPAGGTYFTIVCSIEGEYHEIEVVRRLHGEPMENIDLWEELKTTYGQKMCSDGKETIWQRFTTCLGDQMINPLNSRATDKKLDAILGNQMFMEQFGIWEKAQQILDSDELSNLASIPIEYRTLGLQYFQTKLTEYVPQALMLRRKNDGLFEGDKTCSNLCLEENDIDEIKASRKKWVLKRYTLEGHSGTAVHVGRGVNPSELEFEDFMALDVRTLKTLTGLTHQEFNEAWSNGIIRMDSLLGRLTQPLDSTKSPAENAQMTLVQEINERFNNTTSEEEKERIRNIVWEVLIDNSLKRTDCLVQQAVDQDDVQTILYNASQDVFVSRTMHWDLDPQSIGIGNYTFPVVRVTSAEKTNITGGWGALGTAISEKHAREIVQKAKSKNLV